MPLALEEVVQSFGMSQAVHDMFGRIAPAYDKANRWLSAGRDVAWRRQAIADLPPHLQTGIAIDCACGTGDLAIDLRRSGAVQSVLGADFCRPMLVAGADRMAQAEIPFLQADALRLPLPEASVDLVTVAYGWRNFDDPGAFLAECQRVLKTHGRLLILEFFRPQNLWTKSFYATFGRIVFPLLGGALTGDATAYKYLRTSVEGFLSRDEAVTLAAEHGLQLEKQRSFFGGVSHALQFAPNNSHEDGAKANDC